MHGRIVFPWESDVTGRLSAPGFLLPEQKEAHLRYALADSGGELANFWSEKIAFDGLALPRRREFQRDEDADLFGGAEQLFVFGAGEGGAEECAHGEGHYRRRPVPAWRPIVTTEE